MLPVRGGGTNPKCLDALQTTGTSYARSSTPHGVSEGYLSTERKNKDPDQPGRAASCGQQHQRGVLLKIKSRSCAIFRTRLRVPDGRPLADGSVLGT